MTTKLPLVSITCHPYLQQRSTRFIDDDNEHHRQESNLSATIITVKTDLLNGKPIQTPLVVHEVMGSYLLVDGHHRYEGALSYCKEAKVCPDSYEVPVLIVKGSSYKEAIDASFKVNFNHGVGLSKPEVYQVFFRQYVWSRSIPPIAAIRTDTGCAQGTASNITKAAKWCVESTEKDKKDIDTPLKLKALMIKKMEGIDINSDYLDSYGLPSYSLLMRVLNGDNFIFNGDDDHREINIQLVQYKLAEIESQYGVEVFREGLRKHKTAAHGITVKQHRNWITEPQTAALIAKSLDVPKNYTKGEEF